MVIRWWDRCADADCVRTLIAYGHRSVSETESAEDDTSRQITRSLSQDVGLVERYRYRVDGIDARWDGETRPC